MILFIIGVIEMALNASWTKSVAKADTAMNGVITGIHLVIWYIVLQQVVNNLNDWTAILPYFAGCVAGSMLGTMDRNRVRRRVRKFFRRARANAPTSAGQPAYPSAMEYENLR
jgi:hypothetical protein